MYRHWAILFIFAGIVAIAPTGLFAQTSNATIAGSVADQTGATIPSATVVLTNTISGTATTVVTGSDGTFQFPNLVQATYELKVTASTFHEYLQRGIQVHLNESVRVPVVLQLGATEQRIEVLANASPLNFETPEVKGTIQRAEIATLPLQVSGGQRSSAQFVTLLPGVSPGVSGSGRGADAFQAHFNGGQLWSDEAVLDGVSMVEGLLSQSGTVALQNDFPISPDAVGEMSVLTGNYDVAYGTSSAAVLVASTKEGTNGYHGGAYEFLRNEALDAKQWGAASKQKHRENDFGGYITAPLKIPWLFSSGKKKSYIFLGYEGYRSTGATNKPILTVPTAKMRVGDFSEWPNPIYDPASSRVVNGAIVRDQFMGCDGRSPNVICPTDPRLGASIAGGWLKNVPLPNRPGTQLNYESPNGLASSLNANTNQWDVRGDQYYGEKDHFELTYHYRGTLPFTQNALPAVIDTNNTRIPNYSHVARFNYDHTFKPTLLNHFALGYLDLPTKVYNASDCCVDQLPKIPGVYSRQHASALQFDNGFSNYSGNADFYTRRPTWDGNDSLTWVKGRHTLKFGAEYRNIQYPQFTLANGSGTFVFSSLSTGLLGAPSGNPMASFLLGYVGSASETYYTLPSWFPKSNSWGLFTSDQWKVTPKVTLTIGARWDTYKPSFEGNDQMSFLDPYGPNPGAGGRPGRLAFAGDKWGAASYGARYPESQWYGGIAPRLGVAYAIDEKNVVRAGYGIFVMQNFYPGWDGGVATDGFNGSVSFASTDGGLTPAFLLQNGFPQDFKKPPFTDSTYLNGQNSPRYRPLDANRLPYAQQWNFTVEHQFGKDFYTAVGYVGNKGTRLLSQLQPINALNPNLLSMGNALYDQFKPGQTTLNGVNIPYAGWVEQMKGCAPSVAQALRPYPQYCGNIFGQNEDIGNSTYHSLQVKAEKRFSGGLYALASYTWSKSITDSDTAQTSTSEYRGTISPFQLSRNKGLANSDTPHIFAFSAIYELPFGKGKHFVSGNDFVNHVGSGWKISTIIRAVSGTPIYFRSGSCNIPSAFSMSCIPGVLPGASPWAMDKSNWTPGQLLFNKSSFESPTTFNFYQGNGSRITNLRGLPYRNQDLSLSKTIRMGERYSVEFRAEAFNVWNNHYFPGTPVNTDVSSPNFGLWNGSVTAPRSLQMGGKFQF